MKKIIIYTFIWIASLCSLSYAGDRDKMGLVPEIDIMAYCETSHPDSYQMKMVCVAGEKQAREHIFTRLSETPTDILQYCCSIHVSYMMIDVCISGEMQAKKQWESEKK